MALSNSWTVASGNFFLRRVGALVQMLLYADKTSASADTVYTLPSGFRPDVPGAGSIDATVPTSASDDYAYGYISNAGTVVLYRARMTGSQAYWSQVFATADAWPSSLPGV